MDKPKMTFMQLGERIGEMNNSEDDTSEDESDYSEEDMFEFITSDVVSQARNIVSRWLRDNNIINKMVKADEEEERSFWGEKYEWKVKFDDCIDEIEQLSWQDFPECDKCHTDHCTCCACECS